MTTGSCFQRIVAKVEAANRQLPPRLAVSLAREAKDHGDLARVRHLEQIGGLTVEPLTQTPPPGGSADDIVHWLERRARDLAKASAAERSTLLTSTRDAVAKLVTRDRRVSVREALAAQPDLTADEAERLQRDGHLRVRAQLLRNPHLPDEARKAVAEALFPFRTEDVVRSAFGNLAVWGWLLHSFDELPDTLVHRPDLHMVQSRWVGGKTVRQDKLAELDRPTLERYYHHLAGVLTRKLPDHTSDRLMPEFTALLNGAAEFRPGARAALETLAEHPFDDGSLTSEVSAQLTAARHLVSYLASGALIQQVSQLSGTELTDLVRTLGPLGLVDGKVTAAVISNPGVDLELLTDGPFARLEPPTVDRLLSELVTVGADDRLLAWLRRFTPYQVLDHIENVPDEMLATLTRGWLDGTLDTPDHHRLELAAIAARAGLLDAVPVPTLRLAAEPQRNTGGRNGEHGRYHLDAAEQLLRRLADAFGDEGHPLVATLFEEFDGTLGDLVAVSQQLTRS